MKYSRPQLPYRALTAPYNNRYYAEAIGKAPLQPENLDGEFNYIIDSINELFVDIEQGFKGILPGSNDPSNKNKILTTDGEVDPTLSWVKIDNTQIRDNAIEAKHILDGSIAPSKIVDFSIGNAKLDDESVTIEKVKTDFSTKDKKRESQRGWALGIGEIEPLSLTLVARDQYGDINTQALYAKGNITTEGIIKAKGLEVDKLDLSNEDLKVKSLATTNDIAVGNNIIAAQGNIVAKNFYTNSKDGAVYTPEIKSIQGALKLSSNIHVVDQLQVDGNATFSKDVDIDGSIGVSSAMDVGSTMKVVGDVSVRSNIYLDKTLFVNQIVSPAGDRKLRIDANIGTSSIFTSGDIEAAGTLKGAKLEVEELDLKKEDLEIKSLVVSNDADIKGILYATKISQKDKSVQLIVDSDTQFTGSVTMDSSIFLSNANPYIYANKGLYISSPATHFKKYLNADTQVNIEGTLQVDQSINAGTIVSKNIESKGTITASEIVSTGIVKANTLEFENLDLSAEDVEVKSLKSKGIISGDTININSIQAKGETHFQDKVIIDKDLNIGGVLKAKSIETDQTIDFSKEHLVALSFSTIGHGEKIPDDTIAAKHIISENAEINSLQTAELETRVTKAPLVIAAEIQNVDDKAKSIPVKFTSDIDATNISANSITAKTIESTGTLKAKNIDLEESIDFSKEHMKALSLDVTQDKAVLPEGHIKAQYLTALHGMEAESDIRVDGTVAATKDIAAGTNVIAQGNIEAKGTIKGAELLIDRLDFSTNDITVKSLVSLGAVKADSLEIKNLNFPTQDVTVQRLTSNGLIRGIEIITEGDIVTGGLLTSDSIATGAVTADGVIKATGFIATDEKVESTFNDVSVNNLSVTGNLGIKTDVEMQSLSVDKDITSHGIVYVDDIESTDTAKSLTINSDVVVKSLLSNNNIEAKKILFANQVTTRNINNTIDILSALKVNNVLTLTNSLIGTDIQMSGNIATAATLKCHDIVIDDLGFLKGQDINVKNLTTTGDITSINIANSGNIKTKTIEVEDGIDLSNEDLKVKSLTTDGDISSGGTISAKKLKFDSLDLGKEDLAVKSVTTSGDITVAGTVKAKYLEVEGLDLDHENLDVKSLKSEGDITAVGALKGNTLEIVKPDFSTNDIAVKSLKSTGDIVTAGILQGQGLKVDKADFSKIDLNVMSMNSMGDIVAKGMLKAKGLQVEQLKLDGQNINVGSLVSTGNIRTKQDLIIERNLKVSNINKFVKSNLDINGNVIVDGSLSTKDFISTQGYINAKGNITTEGTINAKEIDIQSLDLSKITNIHLNKLQINELTAYREFRDDDDTFIDSSKLSINNCIPESSNYRMSLLFIEGNAGPNFPYTVYESYILGASIKGADVYSKNFNIEKYMVFCFEYGFHGAPNIWYFNIDARLKVANRLEEKQSYVVTEDDLQDRLDQEFDKQHSVGSHHFVPYRDGEVVNGTAVKWEKVENKLGIDLFKRLS